jgi:Sec-independent protein translocase protein TatA
VAGELGKGIRSFREGLSGKEDERKEEVKAEEKKDDGGQAEPPKVEK